MQRLNELLDAAVAGSTFDVGRTKIEDERLVTPYAQRQDEVISAQQLRDLTKRRIWQDEKYEMANRAMLSVPPSLLDPVTDFLRAELKHCVDSSTDCIGHAFPICDYARGRFTTQPDGLLRRTFESLVPNLAEELIRGSALLGSNRVTKTLAGWANSEPVTFKTRALLNSERIIANPLTPMSGVRIDSLPLSASQFPFPVPTTKYRTLMDYVARMVITIEYSTAPALFHPTNHGDVLTSQNADNTWVDAATVCAALSLEADTHADIAFYWNDYGIEALGKRHWMPTWSFGQQRDKGKSGRDAMMKHGYQPDETTEVHADDWALEITDRELGRTLAALCSKRSGQLRIAASRWQSSKDTTASLENNLIDLRIVMESLYLRDHLGEMRFKLALFGAWHLGADYDDRRVIRKKLRDAYDRASQAVHNGHVENTQENRDLFSDAQALCRRGILRLLKNGAPQDWVDLALGANEQP